MFLVFSSSLMVSAWEACNSATCRLRSEIELLVTIVTWNQQRPLDSKTSTRFDLKVFSRILKIQIPRKASFYHFSPEKLALLPLVKEVAPSPDRKMINLLTFDILFSHFRHSR